MTYTTSAPLASLPTDLHGKVALVTGGSRGIGRAIALKFASLGANVVINYSSSKQAAESVVAEIQQLGKKAIAIEGNVANEADANRLIESTISHFKRLDVLVNNAGVFTGSPVESVTTEDYRKTVGVNIDGVFYVTRAAVPHISENGTILNVSSIITKSPFPNVSVYTLTKAAVEGFTRALAVELAPRKIRVNAISPGYTDSDMLRGGGDGFVAAGIEASVFKRLGTPEDIAETAAFLAVPRSGAWVTGANILSNGGAAGFSI
ncbi:UNVERIFIED_CONTAM: hypothetical protein HDU68_010735 [Siphonaria sp. JEL0065]|nr:hypothetical protein HDU68_010735 [Siphonaria sp. JEL0065]